jgi:beta-lactam-binding protein with PASTA domain
MAAAKTAPRTNADWYSDPDDPQLIRYWDGRTWSIYTLPKPAEWDTRSAGQPLPWWQAWWAVIPALLLCAPLGLIGLWRRRGVAMGLRVGLTVAVALLYTVVYVTGDGDAPAEADRSEGPTPTALQPTASTSTATEEVEPEPEPSRAKVPALVGLTRKQAERQMAAAGLAVGKVVEIPSEQVPGTVLRQGKKAGAPLLLGSAVTIMVAVPYPLIPGVVGSVEAKAIDLLEHAGFKVKVSTETRTSGADGVVLTQSPRGSERAKPGSTVAIVVSNLVRPVVEQPPEQNCTPGYRPCLTPASDYDCAGGSGDGPNYAYGPIYITGSDPYDLDRDGDGVACES